MGLLPAMKMIEPYSPRQRARARAKPVSSEGRMAGMLMRMKISNGVAPMSEAASSVSTSKSWITGCTVRTMNGREMNIMATTMPAG